MKPLPRLPQKLPRRSIFQAYGRALRPKDIIALENLLRQGEDEELAALQVLLGRLLAWGLEQPPSREQPPGREQPLPVSGAPAEAEPIVKNSPGTPKRNGRTGVVGSDHSPEADYYASYYSPTGYGAPGGEIQLGDLLATTGRSLNTLAGWADLPPGITLKFDRSAGAIRKAIAAVLEELGAGYSPGVEYTANEYTDPKENDHA